MEGRMELKSDGMGLECCTEMEVQVGKYATSEECLSGI